MTIGDKIRGMTDSELAAMFEQFFKTATRSEWLKWLRSPADDTQKRCDGCANLKAWWHGFEAREDGEDILTYTCCYADPHFDIWPHSARPCRNTYKTTMYEERRKL